MEVYSNFMVQSLIRSAEFALKHSNCTAVKIDYTFYTIPEKNGTYDGYIGFIHRDEVDIGNFLIRPDSLPYEPGKPTPVVISGDISIITSKKPAETLQYDLTKFLDLGTIMYVYLFVCVFFMVPLLYVYAETQRDSRHASDEIVIEYLKSCEKVYTLIVDQEQFSPSSFAGHIIALAASLFALFLVHGLILNTVGADLVVKNQPATIDSLDDLLASGLQPMILDNLFAYYILKSSPPGSRENKLWLKVHRQKKKSLKKGDVTNTTSALSTLDVVMKEATERRAALVGPDFVAQGLSAASCMFSSSSIENKHTSNKSVTMTV